MRSYNRTTTSDDPPQYIFKPDPNDVSSYFVRLHFHVVSLCISKAFRQLDLQNIHHKY